jgi:hypothetical protein
MRITNKQLRLLVDKVWEESFKKLVDKEEEEFKKALKAVTLTTTEQKACKQYVDSHNTFSNLVLGFSKRKWGYRSLVTLHDTEEELLNVKRNKVEETQVSKYPSKQDLESTMILATIDATTVNDLVEAVKKKYKVK